MDYPQFADAIERFRLFLIDQGQLGPIRWVFPSDVLLIAEQWFVQPRHEGVVAQEVAAAYQKAVDRRLGVTFGVLCRENEVLWCYMYCPTDRVEAEHCLMPDGLKLKLPTTLVSAQSLADESEWKMLQKRDEVERKRWLFT